MSEIVHFNGRVAPSDDREGNTGAVHLRCGDADLLSGYEGVIDVDIERLRAIEAECLRVLSLNESKRQHTHHDEIRAMNAPAALSDHGSDTKEEGSLGCPISRRAHSVVHTGQHNEWDSLGVIAQTRVVHTLGLAVGEVNGPSAFGRGRKLISDANVGERPPCHHTIIAAARSVRVEHAYGDARIGKELPCRCVRADRAGGRYVVGCHRIAKLEEHTCSPDLCDRRRVRAKILEKWRLLNVRRFGVPVIQRATDRLDLLPLSRALVHRCVLLLELFR